MNKTSMDCRKGELNIISEEIYKNLQVLTFLHPVSDDFNKIFTKDMFVKSNPKAFPHIMQFMFTILDPLEFKKRFYWPILDRNSENHFRSSTVQYLNFLIDKHELGLETIKSYIVVMPGGLKFMKVLLEFTKLVMKEELKKRRNKTELNNKPNNKVNIKKRMKEILIEKKMWIDAASKYKEIFERDIKKMDKQITNLNIMRTTITNGITTTNINRLIEFWTITQNKKFTKLIDENLNLKKLTITMKNLNDIVEKYLSKNSKSNTINYNINELQYSLDILKRNFPTHCDELQSIIINNKIHIGNLLNSIKFLMPIIINKSQKYSYIDNGTIEYESQKIEKLLTIVKQQEIDIVILKQNTNTYINNTDLSLINSSSSEINDQETNQNNYELKIKLISTPILQFQLYKNVDQNRQRCVPSFLNVNDVSDGSKNNSNTTINLLKTNKKKNNNNKSIINVNKNLKIDPLLLLRTVTKNKNKNKKQLQLYLHQQHNLSNDWKKENGSHNTNHHSHQPNQDIISSTLNIDSNNLNGDKCCSPLQMSMYRSPILKQKNTEILKLKIFPDETTIKKMQPEIIVTATSSTALGVITSTTIKSTGKDYGNIDLNDEKILREISSPDTITVNRKLRLSSGILPINFDTPVKKNPMINVVTLKTTIETSSENNIKYENEQNIILNNNSSKQCKNKIVPVVKINSIEIINVIADDDDIANINDVTIHNNNDDDDVFESNVVVSPKHINNENEISENFEEENNQNFPNLKQISNSKKILKNISHNDVDVNVITEVNDLKDVDYIDSDEEEDLFNISNTVLANITD